jgi:hypothetical protein
MQQAKLLPPYSLLQCKPATNAAKFGVPTRDILRLSSTQLHIDHMQADRDTDEHHIDNVIPINNPEKQRQYTQLIASEC